MSNGCVGSIWNHARRTYGERYVNISCRSPSHRHHHYCQCYCFQRASPGPGIPLGRELCGVRSGKRGPIPGRTWALPRHQGPCVSHHSWGAGGRSGASQPRSALSSCEPVGSSCNALCLGFPSCQGGMIIELTALLRGLNEMIRFKPLDLCLVGTNKRRLLVVSAVPPLDTGTTRPERRSPAGARRAERMPAPL